MKMNCVELRVARIRREKTQAQMAECLQITESGYSLKEKGKRALSLQDAQSITEFLKLTPKEILTIFFDIKLNSNDMREVKSV